MTNVNDAWPTPENTWLRGIDLKDKEYTLVMDGVIEEKIGEDVKFVLYFKGTKRTLILNKTNALRIADRYGEEMDNWAGKDVIVYGERVRDPKGNLVDGIRVRLPAKQQGAGDPFGGAQQEPQAEELAHRGPPTPSIDDDIPF